jgi:hypothetical protein
MGAGEPEGVMKPRVRSRSGDFARGPWALDFGDGITGECSIVDGVHHWSVKDRGILVAADEAERQRFAMLSMCCAAAMLRPGAGIDMSELEIARAARASEDDTAAAIDVIRDLLHRRTGKRWSVRRGRGADYDVITIRSLPKRERDGVMPWADCIELAAVTQTSVVVPSSGVRVPRTIGHRAAIVRALAGPAAQVGESEAACG